VELFVELEVLVMVFDELSLAVLFLVELVLFKVVELEVVELVVFVGSTRESVESPIIKIINATSSNYFTLTIGNNEHYKDRNG
jgi:hypothetical protein